MTFKAIFFDIDGTLIDSNDQHVLAWQETFAAADVHLSKEAIHAEIGKGADMLVPALMPKADDAMAKKLGEAQGLIFKTRYQADLRPFPKAHDLLAKVTSSGRWVVFASSASEEQLDHYLDLLNARPLVHATTTAEDVETTKPAVDIFSVALEKSAPLRADEVLVVGDSPHDVQAAAKCGIVAVGLRSGGFADRVLLDAGAVELFDDAAALLAAFDTSPITFERVTA